MKPLLYLCFFVLLSSASLNAQNKNVPNKTWELQQEPKANEIFVDVTFYIDFDGSAKVVDIDSKNPELIQFILKKFEKILVDPKNYFVGKTMRYRFNFKVDPEDIS